MRIVLVFFFCIGMACHAMAADGTAAPLRYDHVDPILLNEFAMQKIRAGEFGTAAILLERAALLAPHDTRIQANLTALRAWRSGTLPAAGTVGPETSPASVPEGDTPTAAPPFPIWPSQ